MLRLGFNRELDCARVLFRAGPFSGSRVCGHCYEAEKLIELVNNLAYMCRCAHKLVTAYGLWWFDQG